MLNFALNNDQSAGLCSAAGLRDFAIAVTYSLQVLLAIFPRTYFTPGLLIGCGRNPRPDILFRGFQSETETRPPTTTKTKTKNHESCFATLLKQLQDSRNQVRPVRGTLLPITKYP